MCRRQGATPPARVPAARQRPAGGVKAPQKQATMAELKRHEDWIIYDNALRVVKSGAAAAAVAVAAAMAVVAAGERRAGRLVRVV